MFAYLEGRLTEVNPSFAVIDCSGVGYQVEISLTTYSQIKDFEKVKLKIHFIVREDAQLLFGFYSEQERSLFRHLIGVSGVGANTARMMLSSMQPDEITHAILNGNVGLIQSIKGIGAKTAQRLVLELADKLSKESNSPFEYVKSNNKNREEALSALVMLGFAKMQADKALEKLAKANPDFTVEELIKQALKML